MDDICQLFARTDTIVQYRDAEQVDISDTIGKLRTDLYKIDFFSCKDAVDLAVLPVP